MRKWFAISVLAAALAFNGLLRSSVTPAQQAGQQSQPPSEAEVQLRAGKLAANQHQDDLAIEQYERIEHEVDRTGGATPRVTQDRTFRVVPTGTGTMKLLLRDNDRPADPAEYHKQLELWKDTLELFLKPDDSRAKSAYAKFERKKRDRAELIDAMRDGFSHKWLGQETVDGHSCDVFQLDPNPSFHPRSMLQEVISHVRAKIWVDRNQDQLVRGEAHVIKDISVGGGILGKLYHGGVFFFQQSEVAPGVWLPTRYQYDFTARKFLFTFEEHQYIESSRYHRIGPPKEALAAVRDELASGKSLTADP
jgi:hypothetical protein